MDTSWYREYFWLLIFAGIIFFTAIISLIMICLYRTQFSKRLSLRIQKSFRQNSRNQRQEESSEVTKEKSIYIQSSMKREANPDLRLHSHGQDLQQNTFPVYAVAQKKNKQLQQENAEFEFEPENIFQISIEYEQEQTGKEYVNFVPGRRQSISRETEWEDMPNGEYIDVLPEDDEIDESYDDVQF